MGLRDTNQHWLLKLPIFGGVLVARAAKAAPMLLHLSMSKRPPTSPVALWHDVSGNDFHCTQPNPDFRGTVVGDSVQFLTEVT